jgi:hypothetical protein
MTSESSVSKIKNGFFIEESGLTHSSGRSQIYIQADAIMGVYDEDKNLLIVKNVKKAEVVDVSEYCNIKERHILIWAFQFEKPYYFTNMCNDFFKKTIRIGFSEFYWEYEGKKNFGKDLPESLFKLWNEKKQMSKK